MKDKEIAVVKKILEQRFLPIFFEEDSQLSIEILKTLYKAGVRVVEYTNRGASALHNFRMMRKLTDEQLPGLYLGIGTIKYGTSALEFINAGADFIISPGLDPEVISLCRQKNIPCFPGCMTPTEIIRAEQLGVQLIKLFPGNILGSGFIKSIKPLFPNLLFMPTGGVSTDLKNMREWLDAGAGAVGLGSTLISHEIIKNKDFAGLEKQVLLVIESLKNHKN